VWQKVVRVTSVSACPQCGNGAFDLEPGSDIDDEHATVRCGRCGFVCSMVEFSRPVETDAKPGK
jgi:hypothetical protein